jgi:hypothetical protein
VALATTVEREKGPPHLERSGGCFMTVGGVEELHGQWTLFAAGCGLPGAPEIEWPGGRIRPHSAF